MGRSVNGIHDGCPRKSRRPGRIISFMIKDFVILNFGGYVYAMNFR